MNPTIMRLAWAGLAGRRRALLLLVLPGFALGLAGLTRGLAGPGSYAIPMVDTLVLALVGPVIAILAGTSVLGPEIEDGSIVYLLAKPISRVSVVVSKFLVAAPVAALLAALSAGGTALILGAPARSSCAVMVAASVSALVYVGIILALTTLTRAAVLIGLGYVLIWEAVLAPRGRGVRILSVHQWGLSLAHQLAKTTIPSDVPLVVAIGGALALTVLTVGLASFQLSRFEPRSQH